MAASLPLQPLLLVVLLVVSAAWSAVGDVLLPYLLRLRHTSALWSAACRRAGQAGGREGAHGEVARRVGHSSAAAHAPACTHDTTQRGGLTSGAWREEKRGRWRARLHDLLLRAGTRRHGQQRAGQHQHERARAVPALTSSIWRPAMAFAALASRSCASTPAAAAATFAFCAARRQPARQPSSSNGSFSAATRRCGAHELHLAHGLLALHVDAARRDRRLRLDPEQVLLRRRAVRRGEAGAGAGARRRAREDGKQRDRSSESGERLGHPPCSCRAPSCRCRGPSSSA